MATDKPCPCGLPQAYSRCCGPLHRGERRADNPEALMRSRYAAYCRGEVDYLIATLHPDRRAALDRAGLVRSARETRWIGLKVIATSGGTVFDPTGVVEFEARYAVGNGFGVMHERSRFARVDGQWVYVDGDVH